MNKERVEEILLANARWKRTRVGSPPYSALEVELAAELQLAFSTHPEAGSRNAVIEECARVMCQWCGEKRHENGQVIPVNADGDHEIHWESGNVSKVRCGGNRIRALKSTTPHQRDSNG